MQPQPSAPRGTVRAVLGPTNTGKTHLAIERMLGHASGMIGFPLRLLARENYDRVVKAKGRSRVALVTGEEKIIPPRAQYFICTVESMPLDRSVAFLAIDEIQLAADPERGHIFTQRLLHARGTEETMFLGAEAIRPIIQHLVPDCRFETRPRFSKLTYIGPRKLTRLPPRSAVVAFSAADVFEIAETLRRQRGGTAVVLGALSPRTRNAQVDLYQAGEVDYLVATDAIGMGLNMDIAHVSFAKLRKFDGFKPRPLRAAEVAQIAGRAGRYRSDGTFGINDGVGEIDAEIIEQVETHRFDMLRQVVWRSIDLDFRHPDRLLKSLDRPSPDPMLRRAPVADDQLALSGLMRDPDLRARSWSKGDTLLLWDVCQIPDFRKILTDAHTGLLREVFRHLAGPQERLDPDWVAGHVDRLDRTEGDIDTLTTRLTHTRTWTYISHRPGWLADAAYWQERTRAIEDRLSDALHARLTQRFIDKRSASLVKGLRHDGPLASRVNKDGALHIEGSFAGTLKGFCFTADRAEHAEDARALASAARKVLRAEVTDRLAALLADPDKAFGITPTGRLRWRGMDIARLAPGDTVLAPRVVMLPTDLLDAAERERAVARLSRWLRDEIDRQLACLIALSALARRRDGPSGAARAIAFRLAEAMAPLPRVELADLIQGLGRADRRLLAEAGVRLGAVHVFCPDLLKPRRRALVCQLWAVATGADPSLSPPAAGAITIPAPGGPDGAGAGMAAIAGFRPVAPDGRGGRRPRRAGVWVRVDRTEALVRRLHAACAKGPAPLPGDEVSRILGLGADVARAVVADLGFHLTQAEDGTGVMISKRPPKPKPPQPQADPQPGADAAAPTGEEAPAKRAGTKRRRKSQPKDRPAPGPKPAPPIDADHPFAKLAGLRLAKKTGT